MSQALLICFREGLEAFLVIAIATLYLRKANNFGLLSAVRWGQGFLPWRVRDRCASGRFTYQGPKSPWCGYKG